MKSETNIKQPVAGDIENDTLAVASQLKRRRLLKSTVAIPVIMTLSGRVAAEVARTSNFAGAVDFADAAKVVVNGQEKAVCVTNATEVPDSNRYDLGDAPNLVAVDTAEECTTPGGILISSAAHASLQGKGFIVNL